MQRIAIYLRNTGSTNKFRRTVLGTLKSAMVDEALLCSGFFQDNAKYSTGADFDLIAHRSCAPLKLTTLGLYSYSWKSQYSSFFSQIQAKNACACFTAVKKRIPSMGWHAKVFLAKAAGQPVLGIIGSSNVTRRAFGELKQFNYECDVVVWDEKIPEIDAVVNSAIGSPGERSDVIVAYYDNNHMANSQPLQNRLISLEAEIMSKAIDA